MTHIDVPVTYDEIQIGDFITGSYLGRDSGYVTHLNTDHRTLRVTENGREGGTQADNVRTWTRRVLASDPSYVLTDPGALVVGDEIKNFEGGRNVATGPVRDPGFWTEWVSASSNRQVYRRQGAAPKISRPEVGDVFTRTFDTSQADRPNCRVEEVKRVSDGTWAVTYSRPGVSFQSTCRVFPDGRVAGGTGPSNPDGRYVPGATAYPFLSREAWYQLGQVNEAPAPDLATRYPTLHHLKAAIFDVVLDNYTKGVWCSDVEAFLQKFNIISSMDQEDRDRAHGEVKELIARLQAEEDTFRGAGVGELDAAFQTLGIPRVAPVRRFQVEIDVPNGLTHDQIRDMLQGSSNVTAVNHLREVTP